MSVEDMMKEAWKTRDNNPDVVVHSKIAATPTKVNEQEENPANEPPAPKKKTSPRSSKDRTLSDLPTGIAQVARDDVPADHYGIKPVQVHFNTANKILKNWLKDFSSDNQFNGGIAITKSQFIEIMLDVMMYDLDINPIGYESHAELREDIQQKLKDYQG